MDLGFLEAADVVREITGSETVNPMGYCIGGTLLSMTLAYLAAKGEDKVFGPSTFMVALQDFEKAGEMGGIYRRAPDGLHGAADAGAGLFRQEPALQHVQPAPVERPDLGERRQQLPPRPEAARLRPALLELRRHPYGPGRPQLLPPKHLPGEQPQRSRQISPQRRADRPGQDRRRPLRRWGRKRPHRPLVLGLACRPTG